MVGKDLGVMTEQKINVAINAAKLFIKSAEDLKKELGPGQFIVVGTKLSGACRRASMELTRALAEMRRP